MQEDHSDEEDKLSDEDDDHGDSDKVWYSSKNEEKNDFNHK